MENQINISPIDIHRIFRTYKDRDQCQQRISEIQRLLVQEQEVANFQELHNEKIRLEQFLLYIKEISQAIDAVINDFSDSEHIDAFNSPDDKLLLAREQLMERIQPLGKRMDIFDSSFIRSYDMQTNKEINTAIPEEDFQKEIFRDVQSKVRQFLIELPIGSDKIVHVNRFPLINDLEYLESCLSELYLSSSAEKYVPLDKQYIEKLKKVSSLPRKIQILSHFTKARRDEEEAQLNQSFDDLSDGGSSKVSQIFSQIRSNNVNQKDSVDVNNHKELLASIDNLLPALLVNIKDKMALLIAEANTKNHSEEVPLYLCSLALFELYLDGQLNQEEQDDLLKFINLDSQSGQFAFAEYANLTKSSKGIFYVNETNNPNHRYLVNSEHQIYPQVESKIKNKIKEILLEILPTINAYKAEILIGKRQVPNYEERSYRNGSFDSSSTMDNNLPDQLGLKKVKNMFLLNNSGSEINDIATEDQSKVDTCNFLIKSIYEEMRLEYVDNIMNYEQEAKMYLDKLGDPSLEISGDILDILQISELDSFAVEPILKKINEKISGHRKELNIIDIRLKTDFETLNQDQVKLREVGDSIRQLEESIDNEQVAIDKKKFFKKKGQEQINDLKSQLKKQRIIYDQLEKDTESKRAEISKNCDLPNDFDVDSVSYEEMFAKKSKLETELHILTEAQKKYQKEKSLLIQDMIDINNRIKKQYPYLDINKLAGNKKELISLGKMQIFVSKRR